MCVLGLCGKGVVAGGLSDLHIALLDSSSRPEGDFFFRLLHVSYVFSLVFSKILNLVT